MGLQLSRLTSSAPDAAANKALGSWQDTQPSPRGARSCLPPAPSGASVPGSRERLAQPAGQGAPPHSHSSRDLPTPSAASLGHSCFPRALPIPNQAPKKSPHTCPKQSLQWKGHLGQPQVGEFINFLSKALKLLNCWNKKVSHEIQHRPSSP